jgi:hypothetical protein
LDFFTETVVFSYNAAHDVLFENFTFSITAAEQFKIETIVDTGPVDDSFMNLESVIVASEPF